MKLDIFSLWRGNNKYRAIFLKLVRKKHYLSYRPPKFMIMLFLNCDKPKFVKLSQNFYWYANEPCIWWIMFIQLLHTWKIHLVNFSHCLIIYLWKSIFCVFFNLTVLANTYLKINDAYGILFLHLLHLLLI